MIEKNNSNGMFNPTMMALRKTPMKIH